MADVVEASETHKANVLGLAQALRTMAAQTHGMNEVFCQTGDGFSRKFCDFASDTPMIRACSELAEACQEMARAMEAQRRILIAGAMRARNAEKLRGGE